MEEQQSENSGIPIAGSQFVELYMLAIALKTLIFDI